ncbi:lipid IV(A) palmitoyltransferase PagP [Escherichia coli]
MIKSRYFLSFNICFSGLLFISGVARASFISTINEGFNSLNNNIVQTWNAERNYDLYIPSITWHARFAYDQEKIKAYNERPWGAGLGISRWDNKENWHGLYLMAFKDSFNKWEPIGGYGWEKIWRPLNDQNFRLGLGYTIGVTARDNWKYIPIPVILPLASIGYKNTSFQMTYIPGTYNNGNVYFAWARIQF